MSAVQQLKASLAIEHGVPTHCVTECVAAFRAERGIKALKLEHHADVRIFAIAYLAEESKTWCRTARGRLERVEPAPAPTAKPVESAGDEPADDNTLPEAELEGTTGELMPPETADLVARICELHQQALSLHNRTIQVAIEIGALLAEQKTATPHGQWIPWVGANLPFDRTQASRYLKLHENQHLLASDETSQHLGLESALKRIQQQNTRPEAKLKLSFVQRVVKMDPTNGEVVELMLALMPYVYSREAWERIEEAMADRLDDIEAEEEQELAEAFAEDDDEGGAS